MRRVIYQRSIDDKRNANGWWSQIRTQKHTCTMWHFSWVMNGT